MGERRVDARRLTTKRAVAGEFTRHASPWVLLAAIAIPTAARTRIGRRLSPSDAVAVALVVCAQPVIEWALHRHVLHAAPRRIGGRLVDPGAAHRGHHRAPHDVGGALLGAGYAVADTAMVAGGVAALGVGVVRAARRPQAAPAVLTAVAAGEVALAAYEWVHLLVHSGYRPRTRFGRNLRAQHSRHHFRDEARSFGVTSTIADRLTGTAAPVAR